ncbi:MAG TPA: hypothetical protein VGK55_12375 [Actinomycetes bacterium]
MEARYPDGDRDLRAGKRLVGDEPALPRVERPGRVDREHVAVAKRSIAVGTLAVDDCPELEMQRRGFGHG